MSHLFEQLAFHDGGSDESFESSMIEYENEIYLSGFNIDQVVAMAASREGQEQWGIFVPKTSKNATSGNLRVRKTIDQEGEIVYEFTTKTSQGAKGKLEKNLDADEVLFEQFQLLADQGLVKTRYVIPYELDDGTKFKFEVDVFYNSKGELVPWVKVDAELPEGYALNPEQIPFTREEILIVTPASKQDNTDGINEKIGKLYEDYFRTSNVHV